MRLHGRACLLLASLLCLSPAFRSASGQSSAGTLTCYATNENTETLVLNLDSFFFSSGPGNQFFTVYVDASKFDDLLFQSLINNAFGYCAFSASSRSFPSSVTEEDVDISVGTGGGTYTEVTFSYQGLSASSNAKSPLRQVLTPEEKMKALAAYRARVPAPAGLGK